MDPQLTTRTRFLCDYQIVKDRDLIKERRIILKRDGKKTPEGIVLEEKRYSVLMPILKGVRILSAKRQGLFTFRLIGEGKFQGRPSDIVEALPKKMETTRALSQRRSGLTKRTIGFSSARSRAYPSRGLKRSSPIVPISGSTRVLSRHVNMARNIKLFHCLPVPLYESNIRYLDLSEGWSSSPQ